MAQPGTGPARRTLAILAACAALTAACSPISVVNTGDTSARTGPNASTPPLPTPANNLHLANAYDYFADTTDRGGYYFTTPSGRWRCAIVPHSQAGCQSAGNSSMRIPGGPDTVTDADGDSAVPNAIVVDDVDDAHFASLRAGTFSPAGAPAKILKFNTVLDAAGFRCNVQQSAGVSCASETTGKGFTFSGDGYTPQYTDVPDNAPAG
jgi:hypothetical protein